MTHDTGPQDMMTRWGLGRHDIARATGLPQAKVRRWQHGDASNVPDEAIAALEELDVFLRRVVDLTDEEPAGWLNSRLVSGYGVTGWDLYLNEAQEMLLSIVAGEPAAAVLDRAFRDWRVRFESDYEVFRAEDGHLSIGPKGDYRAPRSA